MKRYSAGVGLVLIALTAAGCGGGDTKAGRTPAVVGSGAPVIVPGRPGEQARTATPGQTVDTGAGAFNEADVRFMQMMVPHHQQALEMTALVKDRARNTKLRSFAERIDAAQGPEISAMQSWLRAKGKATTGAGQGHAGHMGRGAAVRMPGMATPEQMAKLQASSGQGFDRLFLQLMIAHHQGALTMAGEVLRTGIDVIAQRTALDVNATQSAEIRIMRDML
jgi:uncharacterized protein (DUF305 family)